MAAARYRSSSLAELACVVLALLFGMAAVLSFLLLPNHKAMVWICAVTAFACLVSWLFSPSALLRLLPFIVLALLRAAQIRH